MRVVHLLGNLNYGGLQQVVTELALKQRQRGHDVMLAHRSGPGNHPELEDELRRNGVTLAQFRQHDDRFGSPLVRLTRLLARHEPDLLHTHTPVNYYPFGTVAARLAGVKAIVNTLHSANDLERLGNRDKLLFWGATVFMSDRTVSVCAEVQSALARWFPLPARKLNVIENGIDLSRFLAVERRPPLDHLIFGTVGRMAEVKDHRVMIDAFARAHREHSHIRLRLLGGGPLEPDLRRQAETLRLSDVVQFCGFSHDVPGFLADLDVYVTSSNAEGLPLSLLEAIATGLPVVATDVGGIPGVVRKTQSGWLSPSRNADALATAMLQAIADTTRRERGERARKLVAEGYSAERMAADYERLYEELVDTKP
jgi:glycosyltransferase involved in cell wall biosynthesis